MSHAPPLAVLAILASLAAVPAAACGSDRTIQSQLNRFGFDVDVTTLSRTQRAQVCNALSSADTGREKRAGIHAALQSG